MTSDPPAKHTLTAEVDSAAWRGIQSSEPSALAVMLTSLVILLAFAITMRRWYDRP